MWFTRSTQRSLILVTVTFGLAAVVSSWLGDLFSGGGVAFAMAGVVDASAWADKMLRKIGQSATDWENGVKNPSTSPVGGMRKAKGRYKDEMNKSLTEDRWGKAVDRLTDEVIIAGALAAGGGRFTSGVSSREPKIRAAIALLQPKVAALKTRLDGMPVDTDDQREKKMIEAKRGMQAIGRELAGLAR